MGILTALRRADHTVLVKRGVFYVPEGRELANFTWFSSVAARAVRKYLDRFESEGWVLRSEPHVKKVKLADESKKRVTLDKAGTAVLRMAGDTGMRRDHPWYKPGADMYEVTAWFSKPNVKQVFELSDKHVDRLIKSGRMPTGLKLAD